MRLRYKIGLVVTILASMFLWGRCSRTNHPAVPKLATVLPANDTEQIIVDPESHTIQIVTPQGVKRTTLPNRPSTIDVRKDGSVKITAKQFGLEHSFFFGVNESDKFRIEAGVNGFYFKRLDLGVGVMATTGFNTPRVFGQISYNVWSNVSLGLTYDNKQHIGVGAVLRI